MQLTINELTASLTRKDDIIAAKDNATRDHFAKVRDMANMAQKKDDEYLWKNNELQVEINNLMKLNENEIASKEWYENRFMDEKAEYRRFRYTELQAFKDREVNVEAVKDELMDENMKLIESNNQLRTRVAELIGSRLSIGGDETNVKVIEELNDELRKANLEIHRLQEGIECNPNLTEALVNAEEAEADRWKKLYKTACAERDATIRKNDSLKLSLHDAKWAMQSMPASWNTADPTAAVPASPSALPPTSLAPRAMTSTAKTPSFAVSISTPKGTPKASSSTKSRRFALPHPPSVNNAIDNEINSEMDDLREKLRLSEERAQQNYDEMKEYQSWLEQVEEGQETLKGSNAPEYDLSLTIHLDFGIEKMAKMLALPTVILTKMEKIGLLESRGKSMKRSSSSHGPNVKILMCGDQTSCRLYALHRGILTLMHGENGWLLLNYLIPTMPNSLTQVNFVSNPSTPSCPMPYRTWWTPLVKRRSRSRFRSDRGVRCLEKMEFS